MNLRDIKMIVHTAKKWQDWVLNPSLPYFSACVIYHIMVYYTSASVLSGSINLAESNAYTNLSLLGISS